MANNYIFWIGYRFDNYNKYDIYNIPEYIKLIIDDGEFKCQKNLFVAINIKTGESTTFSHDLEDTAKEFICGREQDFHLLKCNIEQYIGGHDMINSEIIKKYEGTEFSSPDRYCDMISIDITTDLDISIGDKVFICAYTPKYRQQYYTTNKKRLPDFQIDKNKEFFTTRPDEYDLRCLAELIVN